MDNLWIHTLHIEHGLNELRHIICKDNNHSIISLMEDVLIPVHSLKKEFFILGQQEDADKLYLIESKIINLKLIGLKDMEIQDWNKELKHFLKLKNKKMIAFKHANFNVKNLTTKFADHLKMVAFYYSKNFHRDIFWHESILDQMSIQEVIKLLEPMVEAVQNQIVHGIQTGRDRLLSGKHWYATFHLTFVKSIGNRQMKLSCDGIPFDKKVIIKKVSYKFIKNLPYANYFFGFDVFNILREYSISTAEKTNFHAGHAIGYRQIHERISLLGTPPCFKTNQHFTTLYININDRN